MKNICVILNYNDSDRVVALANELSGYIILDFIIVVDNNSNLEEKTCLLKLNSNGKVTLLYSEKNLGYSGGHNLAFKYIQKNLSDDLNSIIVVNSDVILTKELLEKSVSALNEYSDYAIISAKMLDCDGKLENMACWKFPSFKQSIRFCFWFGRRKRRYMTSAIVENPTQELIECDAVRSSFQCIRAKALFNVGLYDENIFLYNEENILSKKMKKIGYKIGYLTSFTYIHNHPKKGYVNTKKFKYCLQSTKYYLKEYCGIGKFKLILFDFCALIGIAEHFFIDIFFKLKGN